MAGIFGETKVYTIMKTKILLSFIFIFLYITASTKTWTITNSGFSFSPASLTISNGDSVVFELGTIHNSREVSQATWQENGSTALTGGFELPFGGGLVLPAQLPVGTHYYVCVPHASGGMKGQIIVQNSTGIPEDLLKNNYAIYPNPTSGLINFKAINVFIGSEYIIADQAGRQLLEGRIEQNETRINLESLESGVYFLQLVGIKGQSIRIVKF